MSAVPPLLARSGSLRTRRRGVALAVAVTALTLLALLVAGLAVLVRHDLRGAGDALLRARALALADEGLATALGTRLPPGDSLLARGPMRMLALGTGDAWDTVRVWKTGASTYALVSEAVVRGGARSARRRLLLFTIAVPVPVDTPVDTAMGDSAPAAPVRVLRPLPARAWSTLP